MVASKLRKLKIVPLLEGNFFRYSKFQKKIGNSKKHVLTKIPISMSCEIVHLQNEFPHHQPWAWKALISMNFGNGILVQDCGRQHQEPQQVLKTTAPTNRTNVHFICVVAGFGFHVDPRSAPTRQDKTQKNNSSTWR